MTSASNLPGFALTAVHSGRIIDRNALAWRPLVLGFHDQHGVDAMRSLQQAVRQPWPRAAPTIRALESLIP